MLAAYAARTDREDPLAALEVGELPMAEPPPGWALVRMAAASLNHHDLWTLRGISSRPVEPPQVIGCDVAGTVAPDPGATVLVHGATGGVATATILLARAAGIDVISTSRDEDKRRVAVALGATAALGTDRDSSKQLATLTGGRGVDAVVETVGEATWQFSLRAVRI